MSELVRVDITDGLAVVTLDNARTRNALSRELLYAVGGISVARAAAHILFVWMGQDEPLPADDLVVGEQRTAP